MRLPLASLGSNLFRCAHAHIMFQLPIIAAINTKRSIVDIPLINIYCLAFRRASRTLRLTTQSILLSYGWEIVEINMFAQKFLPISSAISLVIPQFW